MDELGHGLVTFGFHVVMGNHLDGCEVLDPPVLDVCGGFGDIKDLLHDTPHGGVHLRHDIIADIGCLRVLVDPYASADLLGVLSSEVHRCGECPDAVRIG